MSMCACVCVTHIYVIIYINSYNKNCTICKSGFIPGMQERFIIVKCIGIMHHVGEGNGNPLQSSCLENPVDRGAWWAAVHGGRTELDTTEAP